MPIRKLAVFLSVIIVVSGLLIKTHSVSSANFTFTNTLNAGPDSLRQAINGAGAAPLCEPQVLAASSPGTTISPEARHLVYLSLLSAEQAERSN